MDTSLQQDSLAAMLKRQNVSYTRLEPVASYRTQRQRVRRETIDDLEIPENSQIPQLQLLHIDELHQRGIFGDGVKVAVLDTQFAKEHLTLANITIDKTKSFIKAKPNCFGTLSIISYYLFQSQVYNFRFRFFSLYFNFFFIFLLCKWKVNTCIIIFK